MTTGDTSSDKLGGAGACPGSPQEGRGRGDGLALKTHTAETVMRRAGLFILLWASVSSPITRGHSGIFQLQQSEILGALEGSGELQVKATQLPGW